ncbi:MAG: nuclear transport factor 2 family protein [Rubrivivax sp.]|nr:nuclear transport factor 2 family protein [Rubrivivax sp.]
MTTTTCGPEQYEALIRRYFDACNAADHDALVGCFTPDAVHYFPAGLPEVPWRGAETIAKKWIWCVQTLGSQWTIERILVSHDKPEAMIEWTHWKTRSATALRGAEWYVFEGGRIAEIRAYYAAPADKSAAVNELVGFDYAGRGFHLGPAAR